MTNPMKSSLLVAALAVTLAGAAAADPVVDGKVNAGEYAHTVSLMGGKVTLSYQRDASGGLWIGLVGKAQGYVGVGLGSRDMNGATIFFVFKDKDGQAVYSEESGKGHNHSKSALETTDAHAAAADGTTISLEVHLPADKVPAVNHHLDYIAAYSDSPDPASWHGFFNKTKGTLPWE